MHAGVRLLALAVALYGGSSAQAQIVSNGSFEQYTLCPDNLGQVARAAGWVMVVEDADYYNCGYTNAAYPTTGGGSDGTGYMGTGMYDFGTSAEAFGQILPQPLAPGTYSVSMEVKRPFEGPYSNVCGGIQVYGFAGALPAATMDIHASALPGAMFLGGTSLVDDTVWETRTFDMVVPTTVSALVFTNESTPECAEYIFVDDIRGSVITSIADATGAYRPAHQNVVGEMIMLQWPMGHLPVRWTLLDATGRVAHTGLCTGITDQVPVDGLPQGSYLLHWTTAQQDAGAQRIFVVF